MENPSLVAVWRYRRLGNERLELLSKQVSIGFLVDLLLANSRLAELDPEERCEERAGRGSRRVKFALLPEGSTATDALDQLLNGAFGLRATYAASAELGASANQEICRSVASAFLENRIRTSEPLRLLEILHSAIACSLSFPTAKVWFDAVTDRSSASVLLEQGEVECSAWKPVPDDETEALALQLGIGVQQLEETASKGRSVPRPRALDVKGAFIFANGDEYQAQSKRQRPYQIHRLGWT